MARCQRPGDSRADQYKRGVHHYFRGRHQEAIAELEALQDQDDVSARMARYYRALARRALGMADLEQSRFEQAEGHLQAAIADVGNDAGLGTHLARIYARTHRQERCAAQMELLAEEHPDDATVQRRLAQAQWHAGRRIEAHMTLSAALRRLGHVARLHLQMGLFQAADERFADARESLARATQADQALPEAHRYLGLAEAALENFPAATNALQRALELRPDDLLCAYQLARAARAAAECGHKILLRPPAAANAPAETSEARQLARYVVADPDFLDALLALPAADGDERLFGLLLGVTRMALTQHPRYADLHLRCSRILTRLRRSEEALRHAQKALEINPRYVQALLEAADLCAAADRPTEAIGHLRQAIDLGADWPDVHCRAAQLMVHCNAGAAAAGHLRRALDLKPNYGPAADALAKLAA